MDGARGLLYQSIASALNDRDTPPMNITMNIECSPEEARRLMGLPDMGPIHDIYLDKFREALSSGVSPEMFEQMVRTWAPMGEVGMTAWRQLIDQMTGTAKT
jgi:hypothetical protein